MRPKGDPSRRIPFFNPGKHYRQHKEELDSAFFECMSKGDLINREQLAQFEENFARWVGSRHSVGVNSGYDALAMSLRAKGVGFGDEVICPGHTFVACVSAIVNIGATPVLVDVSEDFNLDMDLAEQAITPRTRAIMPVHLNGRMCDMDRVMSLAENHDLVVVEDCAHAAGARHKGRPAGAIGDVGCFSFYPFKILGCFGDGGAVTTNDQEVARHIAALRFNGEDNETGEYSCHGYTALLDNMQAMFLDRKLPHLGSWIEYRRKLADLYLEGLAGVGDLVLPDFDSTDHYDVWQHFAVRTPRRTKLRRFIYEGGIESLIMWKKPLWRHEGLNLGKPDLPRCEAIYREQLYLPLAPEISEADLEYVIDTIKSFYAGPASTSKP